eukprot:1148201-Pelagomonas_calceolata.AAC.2
MQHPCVSGLERSVHALWHNKRAIPQQKGKRAIGGSHNVTINTACKPPQASLKSSFIKYCPTHPASLHPANDS